MAIVSSIKSGISSLKNKVSSAVSSVKNTATQTVNRVNQKQTAGNQAATNTKASSISSAGSASSIQTVNAQNKKSVAENQAFGAKERAYADSIKASNGGISNKSLNDDLDEETKTLLFGVDNYNKNTFGVTNPNLINSKNPNAKKAIDGKLLRISNLPNYNSLGFDQDNAKAYINAEGNIKLVPNTVKGSDLSGYVPISTSSFIAADNYLTNTRKESALNKASVSQNNPSVWIGEDNYVAPEISLRDSQSSNYYTARDKLLGDLKTNWLGADSLGEFKDRVVSNLKVDRDGINSKRLKFDRDSINSQHLMDIDVVYGKRDSSMSSYEFDNLSTTDKLKYIVTPPKYEGSDLQKVSNTLDNAFEFGTASYNSILGEIGRIRPVDENLKVEKSIYGFGPIAPVINPSLSSIDYILDRKGYGSEEANTQDRGYGKLGEYANRLTYGLINYPMENPRTVAEGAALGYGTGAVVGKVGTAAVGLWGGRAIKGLKAIDVVDDVSDYVITPLSQASGLNLDAWALLPGDDRKFLQVDSRGLAGPTNPLFYERLGEYGSGTLIAEKASGIGFDSTFRPYEMNFRKDVSTISAPDFGYTVVSPRGGKTTPDDLADLKIFKSGGQSKKTYHDIPNDLTDIQKAEIFRQNIMEANPSLGGTKLADLPNMEGMQIYITNKDKFSERFNETLKGLSESEQFAAKQRFASMYNAGTIDRNLRKMSDWRSDGSKIGNIKEAVATKLQGTDYDNDLWANKNVINQRRTLIEMQGLAKKTGKTEFGDRDKGTIEFTENANAPFRIDNDNYSSFKADRAIDNLFPKSLRQSVNEGVRINVPKGTILTPDFKTNNSNILSEDIKMNSEYDSDNVSEEYEFKPRPTTDIASNQGYMSVPNFAGRFDIESSSRFAASNNMKLSADDSISENMNLNNSESHDKKVDPFNSNLGVIENEVSLYAPETISPSDIDANNISDNNLIDIQSGNMKVDTLYAPTNRVMMSNNISLMATNNTLSNTGMNLTPINNTLANTGVDLTSSNSTIKPTASSITPKVSKITNDNTLTNTPFDHAPTIHDDLTLTPDIPLISPWGDWLKEIGSGGGKNKKGKRISREVLDVYNPFKRDTHLKEMNNNSLDELYK